MLHLLSATGMLRSGAKRMGVLSCLQGGGGGGKKAKAKWDCKSCEPLLEDYKMTPEVGVSW